MLDGKDALFRIWSRNRHHCDPELGVTALIYMPFGSALQPSMALGQIQSQLVEGGQNAFSMYLNVEFAARFGLEAYEMIAKRRGIDVQLGEWLFSHLAWDEPAALNEDEFLKVAERETEALRPLCPDPVAKLLDIRRNFVPQFLDQVADTLVAMPDLKVVGFSCLFFQTLPSIALARRIKERRPDVKIVFGGPSMHDEMGREYMRALPFIDAMSIGEADRETPALFRALALGQPPKDLGDVLWRDAPGEAYHEGAKANPADAALLDSLPVPDYENYFRVLERTGFGRDPEVMRRVFVPYETSRGCWWGQKKHCTFCGLNPLGMSYRAKSPQRALEIIDETVNRWGVPRLLAVDNILPNNYYDEVLPALRDSGHGDTLEIWYEIKTNVAREKIKLLAEAGVTLIVPGIESLSTNILNQIEKGVTAIHNIYALKLFSEYGIMPGWGMLTRIPGEVDDDYTQMTGLVPKLMHLHPPFGGPRPVEMHRFSPYYNRRAEFSTAHQPQGWYKGLFPDGAVDLDKVAYYFDAEWRDVAADDVRKPLDTAIWHWIEAWRERFQTPKLAWCPGENGGIDILDTREARSKGWQLNAEEAALYRLLDDPLPCARLTSAAEALGIDGARAHVTVQSFVDAGLAVELDNKFLGLAVPHTAPDPSYAYRRDVFSRPGQKEQIDQDKKSRVGGPVHPV